MHIFNKLEKKGEEGFSLVELIVGVAVLGILALIGYGVYGEIQKNAADKANTVNAQEGYKNASSAQVVADPNRTYADIAAYMNSESDSFIIAIEPHPDWSDKVCAWSMVTNTAYNLPVRIAGEGCETVQAPAGFEGGAPVGQEPGENGGEIPADPPPYEGPGTEGSGPGDGSDGEGAEAVYGSITMDTDSAHGIVQGNRVLFPPVTGRIQSSNGVFPSTVFIQLSEASAESNLGSSSTRFSVNPDTGEFTVTGLYNNVVGGENSFGHFSVGVEDAEVPGANFGYAVVQLIG